MHDKFVTYKELVNPPKTRKKNKILENDKNRIEFKSK